MSFVNCFGQRPQKAQPWSDVFVADTLGDVCMQSPLEVISWTHPRWTQFSEDCLNINIYVPEVTIKEVIGHYSVHSLTN